MRAKVILLAVGALVVVVAAGVGARYLGASLDRRPPPAVASPPPAPPPLSPESPSGPPIDAGRIQTGRLAFDRMPPEVTGALEVQSAEIVKTAQALEAKQERIRGVCAPGSAIRLVAADGTVTCQRLPRGVVSVTALAGVARVSTTVTTQASVPGGVGRYQSAGEDDFLVVPVPLPDGAVVTGFSYVFWDADARLDGAAYLYRSDDTVMAGVQTKEAKEEVRAVSTDEIHGAKVDANGFAYFVYMQLSAAAGPGLMPVAASVTYRLP
jgi:hypothetical protein